MTTPLVRTVTVVNPEGIHLRPADQMVRLASRFESSISVGKNAEMVDCKSILSLMTLGAECGVDLRLEVSGPDASVAMAQLVELIESGFPEEDESSPAAPADSAVSHDGRLG